MQGWIHETLNSPELGLVALPAMLLLGVLASTTSCCTPVVFGAMAGYSGSGDRSDRRSCVLAGVFFLVGTAAALALLGAVAGFVGQTAGRKLGQYFQAFAGLVAILFGVTALDLLPFKLPRFRLENRRVPKGTLGAAAFGFAVGGASTACLLCCNPLVAVPLGVALLQGRTILGTGILAAFALGYSLPLAAVLVGLQAGFGRLKGASERLASVVKTAAGVVLIAAGFYLLGTIR